jgi:hypothetical protein
MFFPATVRAVCSSRLLPIAVCLGGLIGCHATGGHTAHQPTYAAPQHAAAPAYPSQQPGAYDEHFVPEHRAVQPEPRQAPVLDGGGLDGGGGIVVPEPVTPRSAGATLENRVSRRSTASASRRHADNRVAANSAGFPVARRGAAPVSASRDDARVIEIAAPDQRRSASSPALSRIEEEHVSAGESNPDSTFAPSSRDTSNAGRATLPGPVLPGLNAPAWQTEPLTAPARDDEPQWQPVPEIEERHEPLDLTPEEASIRSHRASVVSGSDLDRESGVVKSDAAVPRTAGGLSIVQSRLCEEVRSLGDVSGLDEGVVAPGQSVLVYVELAGVTTVATSGGARSETFTHARFLAWNGIVLRAQTLGRAEDASATQRDGYYLSHQFEIPTDFPEGEYVLELTVTDVSGQTSATTRVPFKIAR